MPRQSNSQAIGLEGERWFAAQLPPTWISQLPTTDVGVDMQVVICEAGPANGLDFRVQIKSSQNWKRVGNCIIMNGFPKRALVELATGFTPSLLVLYEVKTKSGWCIWVNRLLAKNPDILCEKQATVTLKLPANELISGETWPKLSSDLLGIRRSLGKMISVGGLAIPILEATSWLMQSLHLIDLCASGKDSIPALERSEAQADWIENYDADEAVVPLQDLVRAETTAHREIAHALFKLDLQLKHARGPILGIDKVAQDYVLTCEKFIPSFSSMIGTNLEGVEFSAAPFLMAQHRPEVVRMVTQVVGRLTTLALESLRA